ncbi:trehalose-phosphatase [Tomitella cavernea]|uniref:Trehalose-phosphatase n=1 Tax=Tomitella cavernea TaxID=1387982 RepID=A0ABP9D1T6_9ACTN|nr:trehalose-phosphatase [Tomitella cavernea]
MSSLPDDLRRTLTSLARAPRLLVASDYDGTIAPIVNNPVDAHPRPESVTALRNLAALPGTVAAVISGRALRDLATLSRLPSEVHLVGSHGSEFDIGFIEEIDASARALLGRVVDALQEIADETPGATVETKPASAALHVRNVADAAAADTAVHSARTGPAEWSGVQSTEGKAVIELSVVTTDKGDALDILRHREGASATVFFGDDVTDERAFRRLHGPDAGIKVGPGPTGAHFRVDDTEDVARVLAFLLEQRRAWLLGAHATPIERHTMLASPDAKALVTPAGSINWLCHPDPDSAGLFSALLGSDSAGHFTVVPEHGGLPLSQEYVDGTMTVETRWASLLVTDYLPHDVPRGRVNLTRVISGTAVCRVVFAPRPEFGQVRVQIEAAGEGLHVQGTNDPIVLRSPGVRWRIVGDGLQQSAEAVVDPSDAPVVLELRCGTDDLSAAPRPEAEVRAEAEDYWRTWAQSLTLPPLKPSLMKRSALTLRGLVHADTGSIMAAATTSLPEEIGGVRNWDYRYCWLRDASMTASALISVGSLGEAAALLDWLHGVLDTLSGPERLNPLYTLDGAGLPPEAVLDTLPGYAGSRPVRVGNAANQQVQLDVFGPITELVADLARARRTAGADAGAALNDRDWSLVRAMTSAVAQRWTEPDNGIWEIRGAPRHHVYSKVMCWVTIDRALALAADFEREAEADWESLRAKIADDVIENGWSAQAHSYTAAYDGVDLDAASLFIGLSGLLDPADPRFAATVSATEAVLRSGSTVYRYRSDDGLPGTEGGFHLCAAWLVEAYLLVGQRSQAEALFNQLAAAAGPTGLLPEEHDPVAERALGNHPQAYSHIGLLRCAQLLSAQ